MNIKQKIKINFKNKKNKKIFYNNKLIKKI